MVNTMRTLACLILFLAAPVVQAQMYKCTEDGKTRYSDKPIADCKSATTLQAPPPPEASSAPAAKRPPSKSAPKAAQKMAKDVVKNPAPAPRARQDSKGASPAPPQQVAKAVPTEHDKKYAAAQCRSLKEEETWLRSPRGAKVDGRDERLAQVRQALAACTAR